MEISPITGIRAMQVVKVPPADSGLSKVFDIENSSKPGDDSYSGNRKKAAGGEDDETEEMEEEVDNESSALPAQVSPTTQINYFA
jgi:hypothetical protein